MRGSAGAKSQDRGKQAPHDPEDEENDIPDEIEEDEEQDELEEDVLEREESTKVEKKSSTAAPKSKQRVEITEEPVRPVKQKLIPYVDVPPMKVPVKLVQDFYKEGMPPAGKQGPAYRNRAPVQDNDGTLAEILKIIGDVKIELTQEQLMKLSKEARQMWIKHLSPKRIPTKTEVKNVHTAAEVPFDTEIELGHEYVDAGDLPPASFKVLEQACDGLPKGAIVIGDPVEQYLNALDADEEPRKIMVAGESHALKALHPVINGTGKEESLLDGGSQIVSMAQATAVRLGIAWDPGVVIHMQSANKQVEKTLGLGRNVPFRFDDITVYLQVHIMASPAYKVLLGRPFEVLTELETKNAKDGSQLITIKDPNDGRRCTMPTYDRGQSPSISKRLPSETDFRTSRS